MTVQKEVIIDGISYPVTISDENEALQAALAAGRAIIGIWSPQGTSASAFSDCLYLVSDPEDISQQLLERAVRRHLDLPWILGETKHLMIREFASSDPLEPVSKEDADGTFSHWERREEYRKNQYRFCECGLWALVEKSSGQLVGKAGITGEELGYHIYPPFRRRGYALEACRKILELARNEFELSRLFVHIREENKGSIHLAEQLGFEIYLSENKKEPDVYEMVLYFM